jgi:hypothetical protein
MKRHPYPETRERRIVAGSERKLWAVLDENTDKTVETLRGIFKDRFKQRDSFTLIARCALSSYLERLESLTPEQEQTEKLRILAAINGVPMDSSKGRYATAQAVLEATGTKAPDSEPVQKLVEALKGLGWTVEPASGASKA